MSLSRQVVPLAIFLGLFLGLVAWMYPRVEHWQMSVALLEAARQGDKPRVIRLIAAGADPLVRETPPDTRSIIHYAAFHGWDDVLEMLIDEGVPVDLKDSGNITPLMLVVVGSGGTDVAGVEYLIKHGADPNAHNRSGKSARDLARTTPSRASWGAVERALRPKKTTAGKAISLNSQMRYPCLPFTRTA